MTISLSEHEKAVEAAYREGYYDYARGYEDATDCWLLSNSRATLPSRPSTFGTFWTGPGIDEQGAVA